MLSFVCSILDFLILRRRDSTDGIEPEAQVQIQPPARNNICAMMQSVLSENGIFNPSLGVIVQMGNHAVAEPVISDHGYDDLLFSSYLLCCGVLIY